MVGPFTTASGVQVSSTNSVLDGGGTFTGLALSSSFGSSVGSFSFYVEGTGLPGSFDAADFGASFTNGGTSGCRKLPR